MLDSALFRLSTVVFALLLSAVVPLQAAADYTTLKKFLSARMFSEAYLEMMRCELANKAPDPKLAKLKKDLVSPTRKEATTRAKVKADDAMLFTILADLDFQEGQVEQGIKKISRALENKPTDLTHYVFAKLLFSKGNIQQSFEQMEKALHLNPGSEVIFDDFQFLYQSRAYGVTAAKRLTPDPGFLKRIVPVAAKSGPPLPPESPFENDPTQQPEPVEPPPEPEPEPDPLGMAQTPDQTGPKTGSGTNGKTGTATSRSTAGVTGTGTDTGGAAGGPTGTATDIGFPTDPLAAAGTGTGEDIDFPMDPGTGTGVAVAVPTTGTPSQTGTATGKATGTGPAATSDPEQKKIQEAEYWLEQARNKFKDGALADAEANLKKARGFMPDLIGGDDLQGQIDQRRKLETDYTLAVSFYETEKYDNAREGIARAFEADPKKFSEAPFYLGKIYLLGSEKDYKKARTFFDLFLQNPDANLELKRDVEWVVIGILTDDGDYAEAYRRFTEFIEREPDYARNQETYWKLKYRLWYRNYQTEVHIGLGLFLGAFVLVFALMLIPSFGALLLDPLKRAQHLFERQKYEQAVKVIEDALKRKKHPIQIERQMHEVAVECHFLLKNYVRCQDHAKQLLTLFADNIVGWKYLTKAYLLTNDNSDDAITMYETMYRRDPENKDYLPILAKYYAEHKVYSVEAMEVMEAYFQLAPTSRDNIVALAEGFLQNKRMDELSIHVLSEALKIKPDQVSYRELLARGFSKVGKFAEASRECLAVLKGNPNNMGIHVVYTSCMKKLNMLDEAVLQYEEFLRKSPGNPQLQSILTDLRKELESASGRGGSLTSHVEGLSPFSDEMVSDGLGDLPELPISGSLAGQDVEGFTEPLPEGFDPDAGSVPIPEFLKHDLAASGKPAAPFVTPPLAPASAGRPTATSSGRAGADEGETARTGENDGFPPAAPKATQTRPKAATKAPADDDDLEALLPPRKPDAPPAPGSKRSLRPEEDRSGKTDSAAAAGGSRFKVSTFAGGETSSRASRTAKKDAPAPVAEDTASVLDNIGIELPVEPLDDLIPGEGAPGGAGTPGDLPVPPEPSKAPEAPSPAGKQAAGGLDLNDIRKKLSARKYEEVVNLLAPQFATGRRKEIGLLLADAYLLQKKPELACEVLETLDFDREMMGEDVKDILYRVAVALEEGKLVPEALRLYDIICNVDINYLDAFDRSDRLYASQPKKK